MTENKKNDENIFFCITEKDYQDNNEIYKFDFTNENNYLIIPQFINYRENFTVKDLLLICNYYKITKELKLNKFNKDEIIQILVIYELNPLNSEIVFKRQTLWFYINELKNDKFMKKYVLL